MYCSPPHACQRAALSWCLSRGFLDLVRVLCQGRSGATVCSTWVCRRSGTLESTMPRKSFSELTIVPPHRGGASTRPAPPADLDANERRLWLELVNSCAPTHFRPSDGPLLRAYVSAIG